MFTGTPTKVVAILGGLFFATLALTAGATRAAIIGTYVDADPTGGSPNTTPSSAFPSGFTYANSYTDNLWDVRAGLGTNNTVIEAGGQGSNGAENPPLITTTVTGLVSGTYNVYVLFGSTTSSLWSVRAALTGGSLVEYDNTSPGVIDTGLLPGSASIHLYEAKIGTVTSVTSFAVNVRNSTHTGIIATFYDGVAYAPVPEPSAFALLSGGMMFFVRRRAKR